MLSLPFVWSRPLEFHETDMAGIAHFANFYRWMEAAEQEFLRSRGVNFPAKINAAEIVWPRVHCDCQFKNPLRFGDEIEVSLLSLELGSRSISYKFEIRAAARAEIAAEGAMSVVCALRDGNKIRAIAIPDTIREKLRPSA